MKGHRDHAADALAHLDVLREHLQHGDLDERLVLDAVCLRLASAIDAAGRLDAAQRERAFGKAWPQIRATRNRIAHAYLEVSVAVVRATVRDELDWFEAALRGVVR